MRGSLHGVVGKIFAASGGTNPILVPKTVCALVVENRRNTRASEHIYRFLFMFAARFTAKGHKSWNSTFGGFTEKN